MTDYRVDDLANPTKFAFSKVDNDGNAIGPTLLTLKIGDYIFLRPAANPPKWQAFVVTVVTGRDHPGAPGWVEYAVEKNSEAAQKFQKDDVITGVDGKTDLPGESGLLAHLFRKKPGETAEFTVLRAGKPEKVILTIP